MLSNNLLEQMTNYSTTIIIPLLLGTVIVVL